MIFDSLSNFFEKFESKPLKLNLQRNQKLFTNVKDTRSTKHQTIIVLANVGINKTESPTNLPKMSEIILITLAKNLFRIFKNEVRNKKKIVKGVYTPKNSSPINFNVQ